MSDFLLGLHSGVRYLVLAAWLVAAVTAVLGLRDGSAGRAGRITMAVFLGLLDLQVVIGLALLMVRPFYPQLLGHVLTMLVAGFVAHGFAFAHKRATLERPRPKLPAIGLAVTILLIIAGISAIGRPIV